MIDVIVVVKNFLFLTFISGNLSVYLKKSAYIFVPNVRKKKMPKGKKREVPGKGPGKAEIMFIGEAPGATEERSGEPFLGRSGNILNTWIDALGFLREEVYITNLVKIRPDNNADPSKEMVDFWLPRLRLEINNINPSVIFTLGRFSTNALLGKEVKISEVLGERFKVGERTVVPLYHPAYLLRNPSKMKEVLEFIQNMDIK